MTGNRNSHIKIKNTYICPRCDEGTTAEKKPELCPACNYKFALPGYNGFVSPTTISEQREKLGDDRTHRRLVLDLPMETANNIVNDALNIIQTIPAKKVRASDIRELMGMAIRIGKIAEHYESFLMAGGAHTPELFLQGDTNELSKTNDGEKTAATVATPMLLPMEQNE